MGNAGDRSRPLLIGEPWARGLVAVPLVLIVIITVVDVLAPPEIHLGPLLVVAPALTSSFAGSRLTAAIAVLAVAAQVLIAEVRNSITTSNHLTQIAALIVVSVVVVLLCRLRERRKAELSKVRSVADLVQQVLLRPPPARIGPLRLAFAYETSVDEARVGGDFSSAVRTSYGTRLLIGDIRGKGLEAVDEAALVLGAFRAAAHRDSDTRALARHLDRVMSWNTTRVGGDTSENFATALLLDIPDDRPEVTVFSCGHPPALLLHAGSATSLHASDPAPPLGLASLSPASGTAQAFPFAPGDTLLLYTDGVIEARNADGTFYPLLERLPRWHDAPSPDRLVALVHDDLLSHAGANLNDDAALLAVQRYPSSQAGPHQEQCPEGNSTEQAVELPAQANPDASEQIVVPADRAGEPTEQTHNRRS